MKHWFATRKEANAALKKMGQSGSAKSVWKWTHSKRKLPFFVGSELEWLNA